MIDLTILIYLAGVALMLALVAWRAPYEFACDAAWLAFGWPLVVPLGVTYELHRAWSCRPSVWRLAFATVCLCVPSCAFAIYALLQPGLGTWSVLLQALAASIHIALVASSIGRMRSAGGVA